MSGACTTVCAEEPAGTEGDTEVAAPDQHLTALIDCQALARDEFDRQVFQGRIIELELSLERTVGQAAAPLEQGDGLVQHLLKGHGSPFPLHRFHGQLRLAPSVPHSTSAVQQEISLVHTRVRPVYWHW